MNESFELAFQSLIKFTLLETKRVTFFFHLSIEMSVNKDANKLLDQSMNDLIF